MQRCGGCAGAGRRCRGGRPACGRSASNAGAHSQFATGFRHAGARCPRQRDGRRYPLYRSGVGVLECPGAAGACRMLPFAGIEADGMRSAPRASGSGPSCLTPFALRGLAFANRLVVSPMAQYMAEDGVPGDWHMAHLGMHALGGAGLVIAEMTCVSAEARITPGCPGLWNDRQAAAWRRITDFVHAHTPARIGVQIGHAGRKGSTRPLWEGFSKPLAAGNWPLIAPSALAWSKDNQVPRQAREDDLIIIAEQYGAAARHAVAAGFDLIELHFAHGYLVSSFLSPLSNRRADRYGGSLENRLRFPTMVLRAVRDAVPAALPVTARISCTDWTRAASRRTMPCARRSRCARAAAISSSHRRGRRIRSPARIRVPCGRCRSPVASGPRRRCRRWRSAASPKQFTRSRSCPRARRIWSPWGGRLSTIRGGPGTGPTLSARRCPGRRPMPMAGISRAGTSSNRRMLKGELRHDHAS